MLQSLQFLRKMSLILDKHVIIAFSKISSHINPTIGNNSSVETSSSMVLHTIAFFFGAGSPASVSIVRVDSAE